MCGYLHILCVEILSEFDELVALCLLPNNSSLRKKVFQYTIMDFRVQQYQSVNITHLSLSLYGVSLHTLSWPFPLSIYQSDITGVACLRYCQLVLAAMFP